MPRPDRTTARKPETKRGGAEGQQREGPPHTKGFHGNLAHQQRRGAVAFAQSPCLAAFLCEGCKEGGWAKMWSIRFGAEPGGWPLSRTNPHGSRKKNTRRRHHALTQVRKRAASRKPCNADAKQARAAQNLRWMGVMPSTVLGCKRTGDEHEKTPSRLNTSSRPTLDGHERPRQY